MHRTKILPLRHNKVISKQSHPSNPVPQQDAAEETRGISFDFAKNHDNPLKPADVLRLQRTVGNQAVQRLLASRNTSKLPLIQREVMSVSAFQNLTYIRAASRNKIKLVDKALEE